MIGWIKDLTGSFAGGLYFVAGAILRAVGRGAAAPRMGAGQIGACGAVGAVPAIVLRAAAQYHGDIPMREYSIAAIPADGIGPEVIAAGLTVLEALQKRLGDVRFNVGPSTGARTITASTA